jgi:hypothetical protein
MSNWEEHEQPHITVIEVDGRQFNVSVQVSFDGIEYVGYLWFADESWDGDDGIRDHGPVAGKTEEDVVSHARSLSETELIQRYRRAWTDKRRFHGLRKTTEEVLANIRHLNHVATSMRAGLLDVEAAAAELDVTEKRLHELVDQLRIVAGVEA